MTTTNNRNIPAWLGFLLAVGTLVAATAALATATAEKAPETAAADPPAGQLLIAAATIQDPRFYHSVILLIRHDSNGAFGIAINRPLGERPLAEVLAEGTDADKDADRKGGAITGSIRVFLGGPVEPRYGFVIHSADYHSAATTAVADGLAMTATRDVLRDIGHGHGPAKYLFAIGYAGWGAGQLESEIARRDWFTEPATPDLVFDADSEAIWKKALARRTREL
jgi:putative transcriptional regulator